MSTLEANTNSPKSGFPAERTLLSEAVTQLNIARKNVSIYPAGHSHVRQSLSRAQEKLAELLRISEEARIGVAKDNLLVNGKYLDDKNPTCREFADALNRLDVAMIAFSGGVDGESLFRFLF